jgi:hypothetical protein
MRYVATGIQSLASPVKDLKTINEADPQYYMYSGFTLSGYDTGQEFQNDKVGTFAFSKEQEEAFYEWLKGRHEYRATHEEPKYERDESFNLYTRF